jgi:hypothetical protein
MAFSRNILHKCRIHRATQHQKDHIDEVGTEEDNLADWDQHLSKSKRQYSNELDRYFQEDVFLRKDYFNILGWWALHIKSTMYFLG